jgi:hypothetical protein
MGRIAVHSWVRVCAPGIILGAAAAMAALINTTPNDFFEPGTQVGALVFPIVPSSDCSVCHGYYDVDQEPYTRWAASMMAQSARDPVFWAAVAIANQDMEGIGTFCIKCHSPGGWLAGNATPADGSALTTIDLDGVNCNACHRLVDPIFERGNPSEDEAILARLGTAIPTDPHNGQFVMDPEDRRRGPRDLEDFFWHSWLESPHHRQSAVCASCHEVSNPAFTRQPDGTYLLGPLDTPHPTNLKGDEFPIERTFSEWAASAYARGPIDSGGRFGGNNPLVSSCQDCHMPKTEGYACNEVFSPVFRSDLALHDFNGANTWVLKAVRNLYPDAQTGLSEQSVNDALARTTAMLQAACDLELSQEQPTQLNVRIVNYAGHKLPTGYPEGRRMWINVRFLDHVGNLVSEHGAYDLATATLDASDTKVYEAKLGLDEAMSTLTGIPTGPSFRMALVNVRLFDNRIPPIGFTNAALEAAGAEPVGQVYADGQHWDDTEFWIPPGATRAQVAVYFQTTSREYIEFLRDENRTNSTGQVAHDQWLLTGRSEPVAMASSLVELAIPGDLNGDGKVDQQDLGILLADFGCRAGVGLCPGDADGDGKVDQQDLGLLLAYFGTGVR